ncbi:MAG: type II toxin-antitoxin system VapC family toxin [Verrucomicrobiae bacterium]
MTRDYADSSFLVSLYCDDANGEEARRFMARHPVTLAFNPFHRLEVFNGLRLRVHRGSMSQQERAEALIRIDENLANGLLVHTSLPWTDALRQAEHLSAVHAEQIGSRSADTLHVAAALLAGTRRFLSFDKRQRQLAKAAGLDVKP